MIRLSAHKTTLSLSWITEAESGESAKELFEKVQGQINSLKDQINMLSLPDDLQIRHSVQKYKIKKGKIVIGEVDPNEVFPYITLESKKNNVKREYILNEVSYSVKMNSQRYFVFKNNPSCVACGITGTKCFLETHHNDQHPHFNFYAVDEDGSLVLMTKDHIQSKSSGGSNSLSNYQTMCVVCNNLKGSARLSIENIQKLREIYKENKPILSRPKLAQMIESARSKLVAENQSKPKLKGCISKFDLDLIRTGNEIIAATPPERIKNNLHVHIACIKRGTLMNPIGIQDKKLIFELGSEVFSCKSEWFDMLH